MDKRNTEAKPNQRMAAKAPYNFVPLNICVVKAQEVPSFSKFYKDRYSGYIELEIETITPLFIGTKEKCSQFFSPAGKPRIPGSTLRGMTRTLVEIVSYGKYGFCDKSRRLYYRAVAGSSSLDKSYRELFVDRNDYFKYKFSAGIMRKEGNTYRIYPSKFCEKTQIYRIEFNNLPDELKDKKPYYFEVVYYKPVSVKVHKHSKVNLKYAKITSISLSQDSEHPQRGYLIISGNVEKKKHMHWIINEPEEHNYIVIPEKKIEEYRNDEKRDPSFDILKILNECGEVPVFFITDQANNVIAFGHTGFFRLSYDYTIGEHIPKNLQSDDVIDFAEAIFGKAGQTNSFASRVFFEDAELIETPENLENIFLTETSPKILSAPKPTAFQHYLEQPEGVQTSKDKLHHWNTKEAKIRGYKLYWHRNTPDEPYHEHSWSEGKIIKDSEQHTVIKPIGRGVKFKSRIRFENLSKEELGCLLFVLDLPDGYYHKIGMGKPLGLGTIKIKPTLFLIDKKIRYSSLFHEDEWELGIERKETLQDYKSDFEKYIMRNIPDEEKDNANSLWETKRLKELKILLCWEHNNCVGWLEKTRYMTIGDRAKKIENEFRKRTVLPKPSEVIQGD